MGNTNVYRNRLASFTLLSLLCVTSLGFTHTASATLIVSWGGNYVSANTPLDSSPTTGSNWITYNYSTTVPKSPSPVNGYTGPTFYGAVSLASSATEVPSFSTIGLVNGAGSTNDSLRFQASVTSGSTWTARGLVFFKKEDFLGGGANSTVVFDASSSLSMAVTSGLNSTAPNTRRYGAAVYALVDGTWNWYVSQSTGAGSSTFMINNLGSQLWAIYDIDSATAPLNAIPTSSSLFNTTGSEFDEVAMVGLFFNYVQTSNITFSVSSLEVNATVVPEPSKMCN